MNTLILPAPVAAYFAADRQSPEALARCFMPTATVKDDGQTHAGVQAIKAWKAAASAASRYTVEPLALDQSAGAQVVRGRVSGNFPGSPVDLSYHFRLERGLIAALEITA